VIFPKSCISSANSITGAEPGSAGFPEAVSGMLITLVEMALSLLSCPQEARKTDAIKMNNLVFIFNE
jgi:hypothetical protein